MTAAVSSLTTTPPGGEKLVMLFDGHCRFCTQSAKKLARWFPGSVKATSFQDDGVLERQAEAALDQEESIPIRRLSVGRDKGPEE